MPRIPDLVVSMDVSQLGALVQLVEALEARVAALEARDEQVLSEAYELRGERLHKALDQRDAAQAALDGVYERLVATAKERDRSPTRCVTVNLTEREIDALRMGAVLVVLPLPVGPADGGS